MEGPKFPDGVSAPRHVEVPPEVIDALPWMTGEELKVTIVALMYLDVPLLVSEFIRISGLSEQDASDGLQDAVERGFLKHVVVKGQHGEATDAYGTNYNTSPIPTRN